MSRCARLVALLLVASGLAGCRFQMNLVREDTAVEADRYDAIRVGEDGRREVLAALGPPDRIFYGRSELVFDYLWARHRGTDSRLFLPSDLLPFFDPLFVFSIPRAFFDLSEEPEEFAPTFGERLARLLSTLPERLVPFTRGEELLILNGHQLRRDRVRVVFGRDTLTVTGKSLRHASGEYREESISDRALLRGD